jgi:sugar O-acyltransferase (sialic acid O-acetyltransferase NeuD family)
VQGQDTSLVIVGAGGHGRVVADAVLLAGSWTHVFVSDEAAAANLGEFLPGVGRLAWADVAQAPARVHVAIGDATARERMSNLFRGRLATICHPHATVSRFARLDEGCFVAAQAVIAPSAELGVSVIVNHGAVIDHDCIVGSCTHVAPGASLGGRSAVGDRVLFGAGARLLPRVTVCSDVVVGAGAVVSETIAVPGVYAGIPARRVR